MPNSSRITIISGFVALVIIIGALIYAGNINSGPGKLDGFAQCLKDKGAIFYGAFWCQHCQNQKALFGNSKKLLPYVECSTPDAKSMLPVCKDKGIESYPTWIFADGSKLTGEIKLDTLSEKTACPLPDATTEK